MQNHVPNENEINKMMKGIGVSSGVAIGQVIVIERLTSEIYPKRMLRPSEVKSELARFEAAVREAERQLKEIRDSIQSDHPLDRHRYILDTHLLLLEDRMFFEGTKQLISSEKQNAEWALGDTIERIKKIHLL